MTASAIRSLQRLPLRYVDSVLVFCSGPLSENPYRTTKPLYGEHEGRRVARVGVYRVIVEVDEDERVVQVMLIDHRSVIYGLR